MKKVSKARKWLTIFALVLNAHSSSVCASIRYGFLADAFAKKNVPGKISGLIGTGAFMGFALMFICKLTERAMMKFTSKSILIALLFGWAIVALITGFSYRLSDTTAVIAISIAMRILQGCMCYVCMLVPIDFISANLSEEFDMVNGLINMGYFTGHGVAEALGCVLYDHFGYEMAYVFTASVALLVAAITAAVLPSTRTYLSTQDDTADEEVAEKKVGSSKTKLTKLLIIPMVATMLINANYGVLQVTVTPYLKEQFQKSISYGGSVLTLVSVGMAIGSTSVGFILQSKIISQFTAMGIGALCILTGLLLTFPPESLTAVYNLSPILAFPGVFIAGIGDPFMTIATLRALFNIQLQERGMLSPKIVTKITAFWILGYCSMYYSGPFIAGTLTDYLSFSSTAEVLAGMCFLAFLICVALRLYFKEVKCEEDEEKKALLSKHEDSM